MTTDQHQARFMVWLRCIDELRFGYDTVAGYADAMLAIVEALGLQEDKE